MGASVIGVLAAIALVPSAPVLVPELAGGAATETAAFRDAAIAAAACLPDRWIAIGVAAVDAVIDPGALGTFAGYGLDIPIALNGESGPSPVVDMPLSALITGWLRGQVKPSGRAQVRVYAADRCTESALTGGRELRAEIDASDEAVGVLVVADGLHTITPAAPGGYDPESERKQHALVEALAAADTAALAHLDDGPEDGTVGRVAYQVLAGLVGSEPQSVTELIRGAPFGVGYFVGVWTPQSVAAA